jgi:hypothetical protein
MEDVFFEPLENILWFRKGQKHNSRCSAIFTPYGKEDGKLFDPNRKNICRQEWWLFGCQYTKKDWEKELEILRKEFCK